MAFMLQDWVSSMTARRFSDLARLIAELNRLMPEDGVLVGDGGFAGHWTGLLYETKRAGRHYVAVRNVNGGPDSRSYT